MFQRQHRLDQPGHTRGHVQVPDVRLDRADRDELLLLRFGAGDFGQSLDLDGVAQSGPGAMGLEVRDRLQVHAGRRQRLGDNLGLPIHARRRVPHLQRAVVVDRRAQDHRVNVVAVGERVLQALEHHHPGAAAEEDALRSGVERPAVPLPREDRAVRGLVAGQQVDVDRHPAGERHVALAVQQALAGVVDRHRRGRAGALDRVAGTLQVELVGDAGGERVPGIAHQELQRIHLPHQLRVRHQVEQQVRARGGAGEDADRLPAQPVRLIAGVLQSLPADLQEDPLLRIEDLGLAGIEAEEAGVELVEIRRLRRRPDVGRIGDQGRIDAQRPELLVREEADRVHPVAQVAPELLQVFRPGKAANHADERDRAVQILEHVRLLLRWCVSSIDKPKGHPTQKSLHLCPELQCSISYAETRQEGKLPPGTAGGDGRAPRRAARRGR